MQSSLTKNQLEKQAMNELDEYFMAQAIMDNAKMEQASDIIATKWERNGRHTTVDNDKDWEIVTDMFKVWRHFFPDNFEWFVKNQKSIRSASYNKFASAEEKGGGRIRHLAEIPEIPHKMIKAFYTNQDWKKPFMLKLIKRVPMLQVPDTI